MNTMSLMLIDSPQLSDEAAAEMLSFLQEFPNAFAIQYFTQLRRYYQSHESPQSYDWELEFDDDLPTF